MNILTHCLAAMVGGAVVWFAKDPITHMIVGTETFVRNLEAKARAIKASFSAKA